MTEEEFHAWLRDEVAGRRMTPQQMDDLVKQQSLLVNTFGSEDNPRPLRQSYRMKIVGYVAERLRVATQIMRSSTRRTRVSEADDLFRADRL